MKTWKTPRRPLKITVCITPQLNAIQTIPGAVFIWQTDDKQIDRRQKKKKNKQPRAPRGEQSRETYEWEDDGCGVGGKNPSSNQLHPWSVKRGNDSTHIRTQPSDHNNSDTLTLTLCSLITSMTPWVICCRTRIQSELICTQDNYH